MTHKLISVMQPEFWVASSSKDLYCSQEKELFLLLKKRIRKNEEHALHDSTNVVDSRYHTSS